LFENQIGALNDHSVAYEIPVNLIISKAVLLVDEKEGNYI
jgi:hypothetical protein